jgi:hypothetical protein
VSAELSVLVIFFESFVNKDEYAAGTNDDEAFLLITVL